MKPLNTRALAAQAIIPVIVQHASLNQVLPPVQQRCQERDRSLLQNLVYGTVREWFYLQALIKRLVPKPIKEEAALVVLSLGLYQLLRTRVPTHAAIGETVEACKQLGFN
ncbi:MAG TPA: transcription antitermination factor NusB, partial [Agitococcus sp.]|nr:transcription antitermination factor NusB [Agitococcus sp.]